MQRGFLEMWESIRKRVWEHISLAKREKYHRVNWDIELEPVEIDSVTLFTVHGDKIQSFEDISEDWKVIIASLDGVFKGLNNTMRPKEVVKQRILDERRRRKAMDWLTNDFSFEPHTFKNEAINISKYFWH